MFSLSDYVNTLQGSLFPWLKKRSLERRLTDKLHKFVFTLEIVNVERFVFGPLTQEMGRKELDRRSIARAYVAKAVYNLPTTELLLEMLRANTVLRRFCGFAYQRDIPSASTFSRASLPSLLCRHWVIEFMKHLSKTMRAREVVMCMSAVIPR